LSEWGEIRAVLSNDVIIPRLCVSVRVTCVGAGNHGHEYHGNHHRYDNGYDWHEHHWHYGNYRHHHGNHNRHHYGYDNGYDGHHH
jgi:hypothetical protein